MCKAVVLAVFFCFHVNQGQAHPLEEQVSPRMCLPMSNVRLRCLLFLRFMYIVLSHDFVVGSRWSVGMIIGLFYVFYVLGVQSGDFCPLKKLVLWSVCVCWFFCDFNPQSIIEIGLGYVSIAISLRIGSWIPTFFGSDFSGSFLEKSHEIFTMGIRPNEQMGVVNGWYVHSPKLT